MPAFHLPRYVSAILCRLTASGYPAYLVGGCVRDLYLGHRPKDWDICTAAKPEEILALFPRTCPTGLKHGTVTVYFGPGRAEVTTFRAESVYSDHRRPDSVTFVSDLNMDLSRRDFTINAMAMDQDGTLHDPFGGMWDLKQHLLRTVGVAELRFQEDALRMFRAFRFAARLGYTIDPATAEAIRTLAPTTAFLAPERIMAELSELLAGPNPDQLWDIIDAGLLNHLLPGTAALPRPTQSLCQTPKAYRWTACTAWLYSQKKCPDPCTFLLSLRLPSAEVRSASRAAVLATDHPPKNWLAWKRCLAHEGKVVAFACAWACRFLDLPGSPATLQKIVRSGECTALADLAVNGYDLIEFGLEGQEIGRALEQLLEYVLVHPKENQKSTLLAQLCDW